MRTLNLIACALAAMSVVACGDKEEIEAAPKKAGEKLVFPGNNPNRKIFDSDLFEKYTDQSGVVSYQLKSGLGGWDCSQSNYFNTRSMTNDERFLFFFGSNKTFPTYQSRCGMIVDLKDGTIYKIKGCSFSCCPYLDVENDVLYYATVTDDKTRATFYKRDLKTDPSVAIKLVNLPSSIIPAKSRPIKKLCTHLTLTQDKSKVFLDMRLYDSFLWGLLDLKTGAWERWTPDADVQNEGAKVYSAVNLTHGQLNPKRDDMALMATDHYDLTEKVDGKSVRIPIYKDSDGWYPRIQIVQKNSRYTMIPDPYSEDPDKKDGGYASHERWHEDGNYVYWCSGKPCVRSLANARNKDSYTKFSDAINSASHCFFSKDFFTSNNKWITYDDQSYQYDYYRSCRWRVHFYNHKTKKTVMIYTLNPALISKTEINADSDLASAYQNWHTDPHPQFVCNDKYIVCTVQKSDKTIRLSITPVDQLVEKTK
ncbi:MAG: hypothetical protein J5632_04040 [Bacteroidales bacterium]|nr:hypothetical protein [Bacteroidales bacterium]